MKRRLVYVLGLAMLINFSACSSDDDYKEEEGGDSEQGIVPRRISKMTTYDENGEKVDVTRYEYSENKIEVYSSWGSSLETSESLVYKVDFKDDKIYYNDGGSNYLHTILDYKNGLVTGEAEGSSDYYNYEYDKGYLTTVLVANDIVSKFHYTSGNLSSIKESDDYAKEESERIYYAVGEYTYYDYPDKLGLIAPMASHGYNDESFGTYFGNSLYQMGYFGTKSRSLVKSYTHTNDSYPHKEYLSYKFDDEGYVIEIISKFIGSGREDISIQKIEYENKSIESILTK